jgi:hypothetical protein
MRFEWGVGEEFIFESIQWLYFALEGEFGAVKCSTLP